MNYWQTGRIRLRAVEPGDWESHYLWNQDTEMVRTLDQLYFPQSKEATRHWAEKAAVAHPHDDTFHFQIETLSGDLVGSISTHSADRRHGTFEYGVAIREVYQRQGYATEAILLVLHYYFEELRYQKVTINAYSFNEASIRLHERLGFQREGCLRRMIFTRGQYFDRLVYGLTAEEFAERYPR